jgi:hypothetical protein
MPPQKNESAILTTPDTGNKSCAPKARGSKWVAHEFHQYLFWTLTGDEGMGMMRTSQNMAYHVFDGV